MKRLFALCIVALLLLSACGQTPIEPTEPSTAAPTTTEEMPTTQAPSTAEPITAIAGKTQFTVTKHRLIPPKQVFDAEFEAFYKEFVAAVRAKDMDFIDSILDEGIMSSFGGEPTKEYFYEFWEHRDQRKDVYRKSLWDELEAIITLGGRYYQAGVFREVTGKCFVAPYLFMDFIYEDFADDDVRPFDYDVIIEKGVRVYENANTNSKVIDTLDYNIVIYHYNANETLWELSPDDFVSITTLSGAAGYIQWKYLRSPIDFRLCIEQKDGEWKLLWLIAGD